MATFSSAVNGSSSTSCLAWRTACWACQRQSFQALSGTSDQVGCRRVRDFAELGGSSSSRKSIADGMATRGAGALIDSLIGFSTLAIEVRGVPRTLVNARHPEMIFGILEQT